MATKLVDKKDVLDMIVNDITPLYFPNETLNRSRTGVYGWLAEMSAKAIEDTITLEQRRAADYCAELSNSPIRVRQTAKTFGVNIDSATPGTTFAVLSILKSDIIEKGTPAHDGIYFTIDRRSVILHDNIPFSLADDIIIKAIRKSNGYIYSASYSGDRSIANAYIQVFEVDRPDGVDDVLSMIIQVYQYVYNIQERMVTDPVQFMYEGIDFDYDNKLVGFEVSYKRTSSEEYKIIEATHHLSTAAANGVYYNDDDEGVLVILNNPSLNIPANSMIKVEMKETLGTQGMGSISDVQTSFSLYRDGAYSYAGVNIEISILSDIINATDGDDISDIKRKLIDSKTRRDNITTEHDVISYINDINANIQIIKKRNDVMDRCNYLYTLLRGDNNDIVPANTKHLHIMAPVDAENIGDFDFYDPVINRKVIKAYSKFKMVESDDPAIDDYLVKVDIDEWYIDTEYFTCPFMILVNDLNISSYYYTTINDNIVLSPSVINSVFPYQMITREVNIERNSHKADGADEYHFTIVATLNSSNDSEIVDNSGNIIDSTAIKCIITFKSYQDTVAYLDMNISSYDKTNREFTFTGTIKTNDFITEFDKLHITEGLKGIRSNDNYNSVINYKKGLMNVYFMYKFDDQNDEYTKTDSIFSIIPNDMVDDYVLMSAYNNTSETPYNLILEFDKFTSSYTETLQVDNATMFDIYEVPIIEFDYAVRNMTKMYPIFKNMMDVYGTLLKLTTDFEISLKFIATYGKSKYITVTGGKNEQRVDIVANLNNLNPIFHFKVYGRNIPVVNIQLDILNYIRETYITGNKLFMSNICTQIEENYKGTVSSIKYTGVDDLDASFQEFNYNLPVFDNADVITRYIPEQLNPTYISIESEEI